MTEFPTDGTTDASALNALHGDALDEAIARRFPVSDEVVEVGDRRYVLRKPANSDHLISEADYVKDERLPYWADIWPASRQLAATLLAERGAGRSLLELGCGVGLATLSALDAGFAVTSTDYYDDALHVTRANAWRNLGVEPATRMVNWRDWPSDLGTFDVVVGADVIYEAEYSTLVARCMSLALRRDGEGIIADPGRVALAGFLDALPGVGLAVAGLERIPLRDGEVIREIQVIRVRREDA
jgi:predicted nicotinamide N-methyase